MIFFKLILTNLRRHPMRSLIGVAGIAFGVAAMLTIVTIMIGAVGMFSGILSSDGEIIVSERNVSELLFSSVPTATVQTIASWPIVRRADPMLLGIVSSLDHPVIPCFGIAADDPRIRNATWIEGDRSNFALYADDVVLGELAAEFLNARVGSHVQIGNETFHVIGILRTTNGFEDGGAFLPLNSAENFFHKKGASSVITVKLRDKNDVALFKGMVKRNFPSLIALEKEEFIRSYSQFNILKATAWAIGGFGLLLGVLSVANTMIMSVFTRAREIAVLRVGGFSNSQIATMIFAESAIVSMVATVAGLLLSSCFLYVLKFIPAFHAYAEVTIEPAILLIVIFFGLCAGLAGAIYPAICAVRIRAVEALRFE